LQDFLSYLLAIPIDSQNKNAETGLQSPRITFLNRAYCESPGEPGVPPGGGGAPPDGPSGV
jgi:hypothetical protein